MEGTAMRSSEHSETTLQHAAALPATQPGGTADIPFRSLIDAAPDAIVLVSCAGLITLINHQTEALFGYTPDELLGQPVEILLPTHMHVIHQDHRARYVADPHTRPMGVGRELVARRKDATEFPVEISLSVVEVASDR
jgi:PAS domain S-box-containing protein